MVAKSRLLGDNIVLDLDGKNEILGIQVIGPRPKTLGNSTESQDSDLAIRRNRNEPAVGFDLAYDGVQNH